MVSAVNRPTGACDQSIKQLFSSGTDLLHNVTQGMVFAAANGWVHGLVVLFRNGGDKLPTDATTKAGRKARSRQWQLTKLPCTPLLALSYRTGWCKQENRLPFITKWRRSFAEMLPTKVRFTPSTGTAAKLYERRHVRKAWLEGR